MTLDRLREIFVDAGATRCLFKRLAPNDNSKNQIYLGQDFETLNILPFAGRPVFRGRSEKRGERYSIPLDFRWLSAEGHLHPAAGAQLILYPQYPEVRLSGMARGVREAPSKYLDPGKSGRERGRVLFLGITPSDSILAWLEPPDTALQRELHDLGITETEGVFCELPLSGRAGSRERLLDVLAGIHQAGWIRSERLLADGSRIPCNAPNCGGYTLEAQLGISANGRAEPDFDGWEIKQHAVSSFDRLAVGILTLMTPEPDGGWYRDRGVESFIRQFGYPDTMGRPDRLNFGGIHRVGEPNGRTGLSLALPGFDAGDGTVSLGGSVALLTPREEVAASWSFVALLEHWNRKHAKAAYVPSVANSGPPQAYSYGHTVRLGIGTDFSRFLSAMARGAVYLDPGIKLEQASTAAPRIKRRNQFRIQSRELHEMYERFEEVRLPGC